MIEMPARLDLLIPRLLPGSPYTATTLIRDYSLFPYFSSFLNEFSAQSAFDYAVAGKSVYAVARLRIKSIQNDLYLRFCQDCVTLDRSEGREPYWRRVHQIPACIVCPDHECFLKRGVAARGYQNLGFISLSRILAETPLSPFIHADASIELLLQLARASRALLHRRATSPNADLLASFFGRLRAKGWEVGKWKTSNKLLEHIRRRLGPDILARINVNHLHYNSTTNAAARGNSTDWLKVCFLRNQGERHPLLYLLILAALDQDLSDLITSDLITPLDEKAVSTIKRLFDRPCGNIVCSSYDPPVPRPLPGATGEGTFLVQCSICGFAYRQSAFASNPGKKQITNFGPIWDEALHHECDMGDASKKELVRRLGVSTLIIKRRAMEIGIWHPRWTGRTRLYHKPTKSKWSERREHVREEYRSKWVKLSQTHPGKGRTFLSSLNGSAYWFLYKHDAAWLDETTPIIRHRKTGPSLKVAETDATLAALINAAADVITNSAQSTWITRQAIARELGKTTALKLNRARLPLSVAALAQRIETRATFLKRRNRIGSVEAIMEVEGTKRRRDDE